MLAAACLALLPQQGWEAEALSPPPEAPLGTRWQLVASGSELVLIGNEHQGNGLEARGGMVYVYDEAGEDWDHCFDLPGEVIYQGAVEGNRLALVVSRYLTPNTGSLELFDLRNQARESLLREGSSLDVWSALSLRNGVLYAFGLRVEPDNTAPFAQALQLGADGGSSWRELPWPEVDGSAIVPPWNPGVAVQGAGAAGTSLYMMGGMDPGGGDWRDDAWRFDFRTEQWQQLPPLPDAESFGPLAFGATELLLFGSSTWSWNTVTGAWVERGTELLPQQAALGMVMWRGRIVQLTEDAETGLPQIIALSLPKPEAALSVPDFAVLIGYLGLLIGLGAWFSRREKNADDFFLAGGRIPWWAAGLSLFATQLSAITFLGTPAVSYATDWMLLPSWFGILFFAPLAVKFFLPLYRKRPMRTVYTWLEWRFGVAVRLFGSLSFIIFQLLRMGVVVYLPSLALSTATGIEVWQCVLLMGVLATIYTVLGGMEAVIWTDVLQTFVLLIGVGATLWVVFLAVDDPVAAFAAASDAGKLRTFGGGWSTVEAATWALVLGGLFLQFGPYTADQAMVQRYLTTKDEKSAARGIWLNGWMSVPAGALFILVGTALWLYYRARPEALDLGLETDAVFPLFLAKELPTGVSGLVIAGLFAAAMSTLDSGMHAVATTCTTDWYERLSGRTATLRQARGATLAAGVVATATALLLASSGILSSLLFFLKALGLLTSGVAGVFLLGVLSKRAHSAGALAGAAVGIISLAWVVFATDTYLFVYPLIGIPVTVLAGWLASHALPGSHQSSRSSVSQ